MSLRKVNRLALAIADAACRSDIECYSQRAGVVDGCHVYDLARCEAEDEPPASQREMIMAAQRAAAYIELRGDIWPWRMVRTAPKASTVYFDERRADPKGGIHAAG